MYAAVEETDKECANSPFRTTNLTEPPISPFIPPMRHIDSLISFALGLESNTRRTSFHNTRTIVRQIGVECASEYAPPPAPQHHLHPVR